jgi:competence protein ComEC
MVLGENRFKLLPRFNDVLKKVGLVHVVVVSGYNISLVFTLLMRVIGSQYKAKNLVAGLIITFIYAGISGFGVPALRAWIMGSIAVLFKYYGRPNQGLKVLVFSGLAIILISPSQLFSVSFLLSFMATLGIMTLPDVLLGMSKRLGFDSKASIWEDFATSVSAQVFVNPIISYYFGTVSLAAVIVNPLVLWVVPLCTVLGGLLVGAAFVNIFLARLGALAIFPFLDYFVSFAELFHGFKSASLIVQVNIWWVAVYYSILFYIILKFRKVKKI